MGAGYYARVQKPGILSLIVWSVFCVLCSPVASAADTAAYATISRQTAEPEVARQHRPPNPTLARDRNAETNTTLRIFVSASGNVDNVEVLGPPASRPVADATAAFIKKGWRFDHPFTVDHHAHAVVFELPLSFLLAATSDWSKPATEGGGIVMMVIYTDARGIGSRIEFLNKVDPEVQESLRKQVVGHFHGVPNHAYRKGMRYDWKKTKS